MEVGFAVLKVRLVTMLECHYSRISYTPMKPGWVAGQLSLKGNVTIRILMRHYFP